MVNHLHRQENHSKLYCWMMVFARQPWGHAVKWWQMATKLIKIAHHGAPPFPNLHGGYPTCRAVMRINAWLWTHHAFNSLLFHPRAELSNHMQKKWSIQIIQSIPIQFSNPCWSRLATFHCIWVTSKSFGASLGLGPKNWCTASWPCSDKWSPDVDCSTFVGVRWNLVNKYHISIWYVCENIHIYENTKLYKCMYICVCKEKYVYCK